MAERRLLGIDLGVTTAHTVVILDQTGQVLGRRRCRPTVDSLQAVEAAALAEAADGTRLEVVVEPTGPAWLPVAIFFGGRGHTVYRVPSAKAADLRRFLSRHVKSNQIDAETLARLPLVDPAGLQTLELPSGQARRAAVAVETRGQPYVIRDLDGRPVTIGQAKQIIASCYSVSEEVRRRRRSSKPTRATRTGRRGWPFSRSQQDMHTMALAAPHRGDLPRADPRPHP